ncbi:MAG: hypothetical protein OXT06_19010 [Rhodospirillaceae bacterium]|nr:hypothetical protein [Rhodospirillaceae bacterium]
MPRLKTVQTNYTSGELDPSLRSRVDVKHYYNGGEFLRNVFVKPQGGVIRRPGLRYIDELHPVISAVDLSAGGVTVTAPEGGTPANAYDDDTSTEVLSTSGIATDDPFVLLHVDLGSAQTILFADVEGLRMTSGSSDEWRIQYSTDNSSWSDLGNPFDTIDTTDRHKRRTGPQSAQYWRVAKVGGTDPTGAPEAALDEFRLWTASATLSNVRILPFEFSISQRYLMVFTDRNMAVYRNGVKQVDVPSPYTSADLKTVDSDTGDITSINWTTDLDTLLTVHEDYAPRWFQRDGAHDEWNVKLWTINTYPTHNFEDVTTMTGTPAATTGSGVNFTAGASKFVAGDVGKFIRGNEGYAEITAYTSATVVVVTILKDFADTSAIAAGEWTLEENVWSSSRGWPLSAAFYQGRLYFAGSKSRPSTVWGSKAGNFNNFSIGDASDADAIDVTADSADDGSVVTLLNVYAGRHLQFFASSGEYYVPKSEDEGLTPNNFVLRQTTDRGSKRGLRALGVDGATLFLQREGKALREFLFTDTEQSYQANNISLLASHLILNPFDMSIRRSTSTDEADYVLLVNNDGSLAVFCTLRDQNINGFSLCETEGDFLNVAVDRSDMYVHVERTIDGTTKRYLEVFDDELRVDSGVKGTGVASSAAVAHLAEETVQVILDDSIQADVTATGGTATFARDSATNYQVGLEWPDVQEAEVTRLKANGKTDGVARQIVYQDSTQTTGLGNHVWVRDMPVEGDLPDGTAIGRKKRVPGVTARVRNTTGMKIKGVPIAFRQFGSELLDQAIPEFTGDKDESGFLGWDDFGQVDVTVDAPYKFELLGLAKKVAI